MSASMDDRRRHVSARRSPIPSGRTWRRRWDALDDELREHISQTVQNGGVLREREWAELAVALARYRHRDTLAAILLSPFLGFVIFVVGTAAGRWSRGADPIDTAVLVVTWQGGVPWVLLWLAVSGLLAMAARGRRRRLRQAARRNLDRLAPARNNERR